MAHVLQLRDGSHVVPLSIFDVLDAIADSMGTDVREYIEDYLEEEYVEKTDEEWAEEIRDRYETVFQDLQLRLMEVRYLIARRKNKEAEESMNAILKTIDRELKGDE